MLRASSANLPVERHPRVTSNGMSEAAGYVDRALPEGGSSAFLCTATGHADLAPAPSDPSRGSE
jgi:hypothetical protein